MVEHRAYFCDNPKAYRKILLAFVEGTSFMLTADPPTKWRHSSALYLWLHLRAHDSTLVHQPIGTTLAFCCLGSTMGPHPSGSVISLSPLTFWLCQVPTSLRFNLCPRSHWLLLCELIHSLGKAAATSSLLCLGYFMFPLYLFICCSYSFVNWLTPPVYCSPPLSFPLNLSLSVFIALTLRCYLSVLDCIM